MGRPRLAEHCSITGCDGAHYCHGLCRKHEQRLRRHGDPLHVDRIAAAPGEREVWLDQAIATNWPVCIEWPYGPFGNRYGWVNSANESAHVIACTARHGARPGPGYEAAHWCGNRRCVNWRHLRWATVAENATDRRLEYA